jgi:hypothetical protein
MALGYKFIILRVHSGLLLEMEGEEVVPLANTYFFTAENYTTRKYVPEQLTDKVSNALMEENSPLVFAVNSVFFREAEGTLDKTVVLAMGCESYKYDDMPQVFIEKGASLYVGWNDVVSLEHVDKVLLGLLNNFLAKNMTVAGGISAAMTDFGKDPYFDSYLKYYPPNIGSRTVKELIE